MTSVTSFGAEHKLLDIDEIRIQILRQTTLGNPPTEPTPPVASAEANEERGADDEEQVSEEVVPNHGRR